jgi:hypothetical protein
LAEAEKTPLHSSARILRQAKIAGLDGRSADIVV